MHDQLAFPLETRRARTMRFDVTDMRLLIRAASPATVCNLAVRARRQGGSAYLRAMAVLVLERARRMKDTRPRRLLVWAAARLYSELGDDSRAADLYAKAAGGLEEEGEETGDSLLLDCRRSRALCLARLGFQTEAEAELGRFREVASAFPSLVWAAMEMALGAQLAALGHAQGAYRCYATAYRHYVTAHGSYRAHGRLRMQAGSIMGWGQAEMCLGMAEAAVLSFTIARRIYTDLEDEYGVTRADQLLGDAFKLWNKPDEQLDAARRAFEGLERYGELHAAAASLATCAQAAARLGDVKTRDTLYPRTFKTLVRAAADERDGPRRSAARMQAAQLRLEYAEFLVDDDGRYAQALDQVSRAVADLRSLRDIGARQMGRVLNAVGRARRAMEGSVRRACDPGPGDSPVQAGFRLLPVDSPALLLHLGVCLDPN